MAHDHFQEYGSDVPQRILVVNRGSLLDEGVVRLISSRSDLDVSTIDFENEEVLVNDIVSRHPEVVVMGQGGSVKLEKLYKMLTSVPTLEKLRMIIFHSNDNSVDIFSQEELNSIRGDDFLQLVHGT
ncbi:MAG: hypothetical protein HY863_17600 [Chloroflexi bacterium]|nr:hypothetical protein [Chloroflexota bacterium]